MKALQYFSCAEFGEKRRVFQSQAAPAQNYTPDTVENNELEFHEKSSERAKNQVREGIHTGLKNLHESFNKQEKTEMENLLKDFNPANATPQQLIFLLEGVASQVQKNSGKTTNPHWNKYFQKIIPGDNSSSLLNVVLQRSYEVITKTNTQVDGMYGGGTEKNLIAYRNSTKNDKGTTNTWKTMDTNSVAFLRQMAKDLREKTGTQTLKPAEQVIPATTDTTEAASETSPFSKKQNALIAQFPNFTNAGGGALTLDKLLKVSDPNSLGYADGKIFYSISAGTMGDIKVAYSGPDNLGKIDDLLQSIAVTDAVNTNAKAGEK